MVLELPVRAKRRWSWLSEQELLAQCADIPVGSCTHRVVRAVLPAPDLSRQSNLCRDTFRWSSAATSALVALSRQIRARVCAGVGGCHTPARERGSDRGSRRGVRFQRADGGRCLPLVAVATKTKRELFGEVQVRSAVAP